MDSNLGHVNILSQENDLCRSSPVCIFPDLSVCLAGHRPGVERREGCDVGKVTVSTSQA